MSKKKSEKIQHRQEWHKERFLDRYPRYCQVDKTAKAAGIDRTTFYKWLEDDEDFAKAFEDAKKRAVETLEAEAFRRGVKGILKPVFYKGGRCGQIREYSDTLLIVLLKANAPEKYRERHEISGPGGGPLKSELNIIVKDKETAEMIGKIHERTEKSGV